MTLPGSEDRAAGASGGCLTDDGWRGTTTSNGAAWGGSLARGPGQDSFAPLCLFIRFVIHMNLCDDINVLQFFARDMSRRKRIFQRVKGVADWFADK